VRQTGPAVGPAAVRFDGIVIRSDGTRTRWVNGQPQVGASGVAGLKPGQIRADGKVYEPYQMLRPSPAPAIARNPRHEADARFTLIELASCWSSSPS